MTTQELLTYIRQQLSLGKSKEEIRRNLLASGGWQESDIDQAFSAVQIPKANELSPIISSDKPFGIKIIQNFYLLLALAYLVVFIKSFYSIFFSGSENFFGPFAIVFSLPIVGLASINFSVYVKTKQGKEIKKFAIAASVCNVLLLSTYVRGLFYLSNGGNLILGILSIAIIFFIIWHLCYLFRKKSKGIIVFAVCVLLLIAYFFYTLYRVKQKNEYWNEVGKQTEINNQNASIYQMKQIEEMDREHLASVGMEVEKAQDGTLYVHNVVPNSKAFTSGLRTGDYILQVNGVDVRTYTNDPDAEREVSLLADQISSLNDYKQPVILIVKRSNSDKQIKLE